MLKKIVSFDKRGAALGLADPHASLPRELGRRYHHANPVATPRRRSIARCVCTGQTVGVGPMTREPSRLAINYTGDGRLMFHAVELEWLGPR